MGYEKEFDHVRTRLMPMNSFDDVHDLVKLVFEIVVAEASDMSLEDREE